MITEKNFKRAECKESALTHECQQIKIVLTCLVEPLNAIVADKMSEKSVMIGPKETT